jgi:glutamate 5-kinase
MRRTTHKKNLKNTLSTLLEWKLIPILNENDAVATEEIQFGDNDLLSAKVAGLMKAERLLILTNVDGLYDCNPNENGGAKLISHLPKISSKLLKTLSKNSGVSETGRGGMYSKMRAAAYAKDLGIATWILRGDTGDALLKVARGEAIGTRIGGKP